MIEIKDAAKIKAMIQDKHAIEIRLAFALLEHFNDPSLGLIQTLRGMVKKSIREMQRVHEDTLFKIAFESKWNNDWKKYAVCTDNGITNWDPDAIFKAADVFIAQHCADWIRIFGEVMEDVTKGQGDVRRRSFQTGDSYHWTKYNTQTNVTDSKIAGRRRVMEKYQSGEIVLTDYAQAGSAWGFMHDMTTSSGINRWRVMEKDTCGKMDQVFGLMAGATISGTTADNIFFIKRFASPKMDPIFFLLPAATIVSGGHHSLLEVALPLMLNGINDYTVGLYSTLFPRGSEIKSAPAGAARIRSTLRSAEDDSTNHLMLLHYSGNTPAGCILYESRLSQDKQMWGRMQTGTVLMQLFKSLAPYPNRGALNRLRTGLFPAQTASQLIAEMNKRSQQ